MPYVMAEEGPTPHHLYLQTLGIHSTTALCGADLPEDLYGSAVRSNGAEMGDDTLVEWIQRRQETTCWNCLHGATKRLGWPDPRVVVMGADPETI